MADNKRYYYLKLKDSFFDSDEIKILESIPNGIFYSNLLIKLYLKSLKFNGALRFNEFIPYDENMIATITNLNIDVVRSGLKVLSSMKLIEKLDDGTIYMMNIQSFIGKSSSEADRKRQYREQIEEEKMLLGQMSLGCPVIGGTMLDNHSPEIESEKEPDKDLDSESEKEEAKVVSQSVSLINYFDRITGMKGVLNPSSLQKAINLHGEENVKQAIDNSVERGKPHIKYINGILRNWAEEGYPKAGERNEHWDCGKNHRTGTSKYTGIKPFWVVMSIRSGLLL